MRVGEDTRLWGGFEGGFVAGGMGERERGKERKEVKGKEIGREGKGSRGKIGNRREGLG